MGEILCRDIGAAGALADVHDPVTGKLHLECRVFITTHRVIIWNAPRGEFTKVLERTLAEPNSVSRDRGTLVASLHIETSDGPLNISRSAGCGCHTPLKSLPRPVDWR